MFLALKELKHSKGRFIMIGLIIVLISWLVFILSGLGNGLSDLSASTMKYVDTDYVIFEKDSDYTFSKSILSESIAEDILKQDGVDAVAPFGTASATVRLTDTSEEVASKVDVMIIGIIPGSFIEPEVIEGVSLSEDNLNGVIANDTLKEEGYIIGDTLAINGSVEVMTIVGFVTNETLNHQPAIFVPLEKYRAYKYAVAGADTGITDAINAIMVQGSNSLDKSTLEDSNSTIEVGSKSDAVNAVPGYKAENATIMMMLGFLIAISAVIIAVFFYILTTQKTQQFGVMKAIGGSNWFIIKSVISQVFILSTISIMIGVGLTYATAIILPEGMPFNLITSLVVTYSLILLLITVLSSLFSVRKITKIDPLTALGRAE